MKAHIVSPFIALLLAAGVVHAQGKIHPDVAQGVKDNNRFALELYGNLAARDGNVFLSPYSISTALAMTYGGADGRLRRGAFAFRDASFEISGADKPFKKEASLAREIDLAGVRMLGQGPNAFQKPTEINSAAELTKHFSRETQAVQDRLVKQVDFTRERVLHFAWAGSITDKLSFIVVPALGKNKPTVFFRHTSGLRLDLTFNVRLFAVSRDARWDLRSDRPDSDLAPVEQREEAPIVRDIDISGYFAKPSEREKPEPITITNAAELARAIPDKGWQDRIRKQVDFDKEHLLWFAWTGAGGDRLQFRLEAKPKGPAEVVHFHYSRGWVLTRASYFRLVAIDRKATFKIGEPAAFIDRDAEVIQIVGHLYDPGTFQKAFGAPKVITDAKTLEKSLPAERWNEDLIKGVDFARRHVLVFVWTGESDDILAYSVSLGKTSTRITLRHHPGWENYRRLHIHAVVLDKSTRWEVAPTPKEHSEPIVRDIDITRYAGNLPKGKGKDVKPIVLENPADLAKAIPEEIWQKQIAGQVDFGRERLLLFGWSGGVGDLIGFQIHPRSNESGSPPTVLLRHIAGGDLVHAEHWRLIAVARTSRWTMDRTGLELRDRFAIRSLGHRHLEKLKIQFEQPVTVTQPEELFDLIPNDAWRYDMQYGVDYKRERFLLFTWNGAASDRVAQNVTITRTSTKVDLRLHTGTEKTPLPMVHACAMPKYANWTATGFPPPPPIAGKYVREIKFPIDKAITEVVDFKKPIVIKTHADLEAVFPDKAARWEVLKQINLTQESLLLINWRGKGGAVLGFELQHNSKTDPPRTAVFYLTGGKQPIAQYYAHLFVLKHDTAWRMLEPGQVP